MFGIFVIFSKMRRKTCLTALFISMEDVKMDTRKYSSPLGGTLAPAKPIRAGAGKA